VYVESSLHPWDETNLIMLYDLFDILLNLVCQFLLRIFASKFTKEIAYNSLFFVVFLLGFGMSVILASLNEFGSVPSLFISWKSLRRAGINSLKFW
jgi:hypothetical protein